MLLKASWLGIGLALMLGVVGCHGGNVNPNPRPTNPLDEDGDGAQRPTDCDDTNPEVFPGAAELCENGIDDDCDGRDASCAACAPGAIPAVGCRCGNSPAWDGFCCQGARQDDPCDGGPVVPPIRSGFVGRSGIGFVRDGKPFVFAGTNVYDLFAFGDGASTASDQAIEDKFINKPRIDAHLQLMASLGVKVVRLWAFCHEKWHGFEPEKGKYDEPQLRLLDYIVKSAKDHGLLLLPVFENYWEAYGGIDSRLRWEGLASGSGNVRWKFFNKKQCPGCFDQYKNYVKTIVNRVNHYTQVAYKDDPTIFAWELMNEPRYEEPSEAKTGATLRAWVDEMSAYVKSLDPSHMVTPGLEGHESRYGFGGDEGNPFVFIHQSPTIDFCTAHPYPTEDWAKLNLDQTLDLVRKWASDAHQVVGKPLVISEFNMHNVDRVLWWTEFYKTIEAQKIAGSQFWWLMDRNVDSKFGVMMNAPELSVFKAHALRLKTLY